MVFLLVFVLGGFALHCSVKEVPRETPSSFEIQFEKAVQERLENPQSKP